MGSILELQADLSRKRMLRQYPQFAAIGMQAMEDMERNRNAPRTEYTPKYGPCRVCGKPTRSHHDKDGMMCHECFLRT